jgi:hypothetical protein
MASSSGTAGIELPQLPSRIEDFMEYLAAHPNMEMEDIIAPYYNFESKLRELFARSPQHEVLKKGLVNAVPVYAGDASKLTIRSRNLDAETAEEAEKYIMPLKDDDRKAHGSPAVVTSLADFQRNFALFSESSLTDIDWNNVIVAGSSVVTALLPVPEKYSSSKRDIRHYYHDIVAPASDVDIFLYGLTEQEAIDKIKHIEQKIRDSILQETTCIRTKNAITIASHYPIRHVQIVLRLYKSISEVLTGFDVDCSCVAYDGKQVYASPRALFAFIHQRNTVDLTRRSPSYENRLAKYSHRGFEVYWPALDRSRIDPTIFERSFTKTLGLARLLVLEKLPTSGERDKYREARRAERGRPPLLNSYSRYKRMRGNRKLEYEEDVDEFNYFAELSDYSTFVGAFSTSSIKILKCPVEATLFSRETLGTDNLIAHNNVDNSIRAKVPCQKDRKAAIHQGSTS